MSKHIVVSFPSGRWSSQYPSKEPLPQDIETDTKEEDKSEQNEKLVRHFSPAELCDESVGDLDITANGVHLTLCLAQLCGRGGWGRE